MRILTRRAISLCVARQSRNASRLEERAPDS